VTNTEVAAAPVTPDLTISTIKLPAKAVDSFDPRRD
jgi:hypothetical protein